MVKQIFIDLGSFDEIQEREGFEIISFEPNPKYHKGVTNPYAAWIYDGKCWMSDKGNASTIVPDNQNYAKDIEVPCCDFSSWLARTAAARKKFTVDDHITIKMDIEGAEYAILEKMIEEGTIRMVDEILIEWHDWLMPEVYNARHNSILHIIGEKIKNWH
jgi:FkbM family methyltransferase